MVFQVTEELFHFAQARFAGDFHILQMFENLRHEGIADHGIRGGLGLGVLDRFGCSNDIWSYLHQMVEPYAGDSLQNQLGGAVRLGHTRSNQPQPSHRRGGLTGLFHGHRKHPRAFQGLGQHFPVPLPPPNEKLPEDVEVQLSRLTAEAGAQLLQQTAALAQQQQAQQQAQDPLVQIQQAELQIKAQEVQRKAAKDQADIALAQARLRVEQERIAVEAAKERQRLMAKDVETNKKLGMQ